MLDCIELQTRDQPSATVIWLHGLGADGYDFVPVVKELEALGAPPPAMSFRMRRRSLCRSTTAT
jgi:phospholipase/carboxylesterase